MTSIAHEIQQGVHTILQAGYHERLAVHSVMTLIHHIVDAWTIWAHDNPFTFNDPNGHVPAAIFGPSAQILRASEYGYHCALDLHLKIAAQLDLVGYTVRNAIEILKGLSGVCDAVTFGDGYIPKDRLELSAARQVLARLRNEACLRRYKKPESLVTIDREIESSDLKKRRVEGRKDHLAHNERKNHTTPVKMAQGLPPLGLVTIKPSAEKVKRDPEIETEILPPERARRYLNFFREREERETIKRTDPAYKALVPPDPKKTPNRAPCATVPPKAGRTTRHETQPMDSGMRFEPLRLNERRQTRAAAALAEAASIVTPTKEGIDKDLESVMLDDTPCKKRKRPAAPVGNGAMTQPSSKKRKRQPIESPDSQISSLRTEKADSVDKEYKGPPSRKPRPVRKSANLQVKITALKDEAQGPKSSPLASANAGKGGAQHCVQCSKEKPTADFLRREKVFRVCNVCSEHNRYKQRAPPTPLKETPIQSVHDSLATRFDVSTPTTAARKQTLVATETEWLKANAGKFSSYGKLAVAFNGVFEGGSRTGKSEHQLGQAVWRLRRKGDLGTEAVPKETKFVRKAGAKRTK